MFEKLKKAPGVQLLKAKPVVLIIQTVIKWQRDDCLEMGAALSYYALFSLFPTVLVMLSVLGAFIGPSTDVYNQILLFARSSLPPEAFKLIDDTLLHLNRNSVGAGIVSFLLLCFTASSVFGALTRSMNKIWQVHQNDPNRNNVKAAAKTFMRNRLLAFLLVFSTAALMAVSLISNIVIKLIIDIIKNLNSVVNFMKIDDLILLRGLQVAASYLILTAVIMLLFKVLPSTRVTWGDVWLGGVLTTGLFMLLQHLVSNSIIRLGGHFRSYGVVGSVMVLLLWLFLTCQVFFLGGELTFVYAHLFGSRSGLGTWSTHPFKQK